jgi:hypothetical protein
MFGPVVRRFAIAHGSQPLGAMLVVVYVLVDFAGVFQRKTSISPQRRRGPAVQVLAGAAG